MKKILSIVLSLAVILSMSIPMLAFAAESTFTITITDSTPNHTYAAYQIFDGDLYEKDGTKTLSNIVFGPGVDASKKDTFLAQFKVGTSVPASAKVLAKALADGTLKKADGTTAVDTRTFARIAADYTSAASQGAGTSSIASLDAGYYLIKDTTIIAGSDTTDSTSAFIAQVVSNITVTAKRGDVDLMKQVKDVNDTTGTTSLSEWQDSADWDIGDKVPFKITAHLPENLSAYDKYRFVFHDKESTGLTFDSTSVVVKIGGTTVPAAKYEVKTSSLVAGETFNIVFSDIRTALASVADGAEVTVEYKSELNDKAVLGSTGNPNEAWLEYSNNPNAEGSGTTSTTPHDKVIVFTYRIHIDKVDDNDQPLTGASFELFKKVDGDWTSLGVVSGASASTFEWTGVDDGDYKIVETVTPKGFNDLDDVYFKVSATHSSGDNPALTSLSGGSEFTGVVSTGVLTGKIVNYPGSVLPSTGGAGSVMIYLLGIALLAGSGMIFTARRKASLK